jgi:hypothetical protein
MLRVLDSLARVCSGEDDPAGDDVSLTFAE